MITFTGAFKIVVGEEGAWSNDPNDRGNWTGGQIGVGENKGTKYGVSAASYPTLDIKNLTLAQAQSIYKLDYWDKLACDSLPPQIALYAFDGAVNSGWSTSARWLQAASGAKTDGLIGELTLKAITATIAQIGLAEFTGKLLGTRIIYMTDASSWGLYKNGWTTRVCALPVRAADLNQ